ncbi:MAG: menaquinone biosynthesis protein [Spirochaetota bacterium]|nr:menaquinone biosynthesis protein [Spirochaetota bacterium]
MKLGYIDYLNCYPFYHYMFEKENLKGVCVIPGYPNELNRMMHSHELDMSPISAATCADIADEIMLLPQFCLSSAGYVGSVILASKIPIEKLNNKRIGITSASHTSCVMLKALLQNYYRVNPLYFTTDPFPDLKHMDAALIIGNEAMIPHNEPVPYVYDLGELWFQQTGFPIVFAVFSIRERIIERYASDIRSVIQSYHNSLLCLEKEKENVILKAREKYPNVFYNIDEYYSNLQFEFTKDLKRALDFYHSIAGELGLIKKVASLKYLTID